MSEPILGFVGLGRMGGPMSGRVIDWGFSVVGFDPSPDAMNAAAKRGVTPAASALEVGARADLVFVSLPSPDIMMNVVAGDEGIAAGGRVRRIVDISTTGPSVAKRSPRHWRSGRSSGSTARFRAASPGRSTASWP